MRFSCFYLPAVATIVLLPMGKLLAQESQTDQFADGGNRRGRRLDAASLWILGDYAEDDPIRDFAVRVGYWGTQTSGSTVRTGEYQSLTPSSLFYDVNTLITDGTRTLNFNATGVEDGLHAGERDLLRPEPGSQPRLRAIPARTRARSLPELGDNRLRADDNQAHGPLHSANPLGHEPRTRLRHQRQ